MLSARGWMVVVVVGLAVGVAGWVVAAVAWDLYQDHARVHAIWDLELRRAQVQQAAPPAGN